MKHLLFATLFTCSFSPLAHGQDLAAFGRTLCDKVDLYTQGSYHYFDCLEANKKLAPSATSSLQLVRSLCTEAVDFYGFSSQEALRCFQDGIDMILQGD